MKVISLQEIRELEEGRIEGEAALGEAIFRCEWAINLLENLPTDRFDTDDEENIAWGINMPGTCPCSFDENEEQRMALYFLLDELSE